SSPAAGRAGWAGWAGVRVSVNPGSRPKSIRCVYFEPRPPPGYSGCRALRGRDNPAGGSRSFPAGGRYDAVTDRQEAAGMEQATHDPPPGDGGPPRLARAEQVRDKVLAAAGQLMLDGGLAAATM